VKPFRLTQPIASESSEGELLTRWKQWALPQYPELRALFHVPNGGARTIQAGARLKREGVVRGIPDSLLLCARGGYHGLGLELKPRIGGVLSDEQKTMHAVFREYGYCIVVAHGWEAARDAILTYLSGDSDDSC